MKKPHKQSSKKAKSVKQAKGDPCLKYKVKEGVYSSEKPRHFKPLKRGDVVRHIGSQLVKKGSVWVVEGHEPAPFVCLFNLRALESSDTVRAWRCKLRKIRYDWPNPFAAETHLRMKTSASKFVPKQVLVIADWQKEALRRLETIEDMEDGTTEWQLKLRRRLGKSGLRWKE